LEAEYVKFMIKNKNIKGNKKRMKLQSNPANIKWIDKACPYLLDENKDGQRLCSIYEFRPMVCRTHNSAEDPKFCNKGEFPDRTIQEGRIIQMEAITIALMLLSGELENKDIPDMIPIHKLKI
jgi:Fe-S-cluster containining protein